MMCWQSCLCFWSSKSGHEVAFTFCTCDDGGLMDVVVLMEMVMAVVVEMMEAVAS